MRTIIIIGGGLAGLVSAILLRRGGLDVTLIERKAFPFHRVCGEYLSMEVHDFMGRNGLLPPIAYPILSRFELSSIGGRSSVTPLDLGGFGISRYTLDHHLYQVAVKEGVVVKQAKVLSCDFSEHYFEIKTDKEILQALYVIGAFGKRSNLDQSMQRSFFYKRSPYIGVKYHARTDHPADLIALHNFSGGYCGMSLVEDGITNICYLGSREALRKYGNIPDMEKAVLHQNPKLKAILENAHMIWDKPEVINEISFATKRPVEGHVLMCGDAAGMITPLCGNGMAMAIRSAKTLSDTLQEGLEKNWTRTQIEKRYTTRWNELFRLRLWYGRQVQRLFGSPTLSNLSVNLINHVKPLSRAIIKGTHGEVME